MGLFRNRGTNAVPELPDREGWVTRTVTNGVAWLNSSNGVYADGLRIAEIAANMLEANQLAPMHDLPTRQVGLLRENAPDPAALRVLVTDLINELKPYRKRCRRVEVMHRKGMNLLRFNRINSYRAGRGPHCNNASPSPGWRYLV